MGRPTDYSPTVVDTAEAYYAELPSDEVIHSIEGLADYLGIARSTIYEWCKHPDRKAFSDIVEKILNKQGKTLINGSLKNNLNASISKLLLTKHGYVDKQEVTGKDGKDLFKEATPEEMALANQLQELERTNRPDTQG